MAKIGGDLDHVVLLVPYNVLTNPPHWITDNFTLSAGGRHGDNKTENRLVLFQDGTYLEIIAFINDDPEKRKGHWWDKPLGVVDFALTSSKPLDYDGIRKRLQSTGTGISYAEPKQGGRSTGGHDIKWKVTFPEAVQRGNIPFFCEDISPREWRVPITKESATHPCGALGMAGITLDVKKENFQRLADANAAVLNEESEKNGHYMLGAPNGVAKLSDPVLQLQQATTDIGRDLQMTLVLQTSAGASRGPIRERLGDGEVRFDFKEV